MEKIFDSDKILVFFNACGHFDAISKIKDIASKEGVKHIVSLGNCFAYHEKINECIELTKEFVLLKGFFEAGLGSFEDTFFSSKVRKIVFDKIKSTLNKKNKLFLSELPESFEIFIFFFNSASGVTKTGRLNFCVPTYISKTPFIFESGVEIEVPLNKPFEIRNNFGKLIFPGHLFNSLNPNGIGYYCLVSSETFTFNKLEYPVENSTYYNYLKKKQPGLFIK